MIESGSRKTRHQQQLPWTEWERGAGRKERRVVEGAEKCDHIRRYDNNIRIANTPSPVCQMTSILIITGTKAWRHYDRSSHSHKAHSAGCGQRCNAMTIKLLLSTITLLCAPIIASVDLSLYIFFFALYYSPALPLSLLFVSFFRLMFESWGYVQREKKYFENENSIVFMLMYGCMRIFLWICPRKVTLTKYFYERRIAVEKSFVWAFAQWIRHKSAYAFHDGIDLCRSQPLHTGWKRLVCDSNRLNFSGKGCWPNEKLVVMER